MDIAPAADTAVVAVVDGSSAAEVDTATVDSAVVAAGGRSVVEVADSAAEDGNSAEAAAAADTVVADTAAEVRCVLMSLLLCDQSIKSIYRGVNIQLNINKSSLTSEKTSRINHVD